jgi:hypothetical protein
VSKEREEIIEKIAEYFYDCENGIFPERAIITEWRLAKEEDRAEYYQRAEEILKIETPTHRLAIVRKGAEYPQILSEVVDVEIHQHPADKEGYIKMHNRQ